ncbi:MAG: hypothetical protein ACTSYX_05495 [Candidatus Thorarchaeota archaeon]
MKVSRSITVEAKGIGKPDYSRRVSSGITRPGLSLEYGQLLKTFSLTFSDIVSPYPGVVSPLAAGATQALIDRETGLAMPYTIPQGYIMTLVQVSHSMNQDLRIESYFDGFFAGYFGTSVSGIIVSSTDVAPFSSSLLDPTGATSHTATMQVTNLGGAPMYGTVSVFAILEEVGTDPLPSTKTVRCKFCAHEWEVSRETTQVECPQCGKTNIYFNLKDVRKL